MADEEDGFVDLKDWTAAPQDDSGFVDISPWNEKPKQKLADAAAALKGATSNGTPAEAPSTWGDIGKTLAISPVKGPIHALGTPGDMRSLIDLGMEKAGVSRERREGALKGIGATPLGFMARGPTSAQVQKGVEQATGPLYEPKTDWGKRVGTLANAATNPLSYVGPGSMPAKLLLAETSAAGSEAGRAAAKGTGIEALETPLSIAGGLAGGIGPAGLEAALKSKPGYKEFLKVSSKQYKDAHGFDVKFAPNAVHDLQTDIGQALADAHFDKFSSPESFRRVRELGKSATSPNGYGTADIHNIKKKLKNIAKGDRDQWQNGSPDYNAAIIVKEKIDNFLTANNPTKVSQNAHQLDNFVKAYTDANKNAGAGLNLERIDKKVVKADRQTAASDALKPYNKQRQAIENVLDNDAVKGFYNPAQQNQMDRVIKGTVPGNIGRWVGKAAPSSFFSLAGGLGGLAGGFAPYVAAGWGAGIAGKMTAAASTRRQIGKLEDMIREGAPAYSNQLKPSPSTFGPQSRTPSPYLNELSDITGGESEPPPKEAPRPRIIPREDEKEINKALEIARRLQGASRQTGGRVGSGRYTEEELETSRKEGRRFKDFLGHISPRFTPHGIPLQKFRQLPSSDIDDRRDEGFVSEEDRRRRSVPDRPWPEVTDLSRQAGYDDIKKARGGKIKKRIPPRVTIPETPATLKKQQQSLIAGHRAAMLFPHKSTELALPRGMKRMRTKDGLVHFDKNKLTPSQIRKASNDGKMNEILGMGPVSKEEALSRASLGEKLVAVTERGPDGVEAKSALGTEQTAPEQLAALQDTADPGDWVGIEPVQETLARRIA